MEKAKRYFQFMEFADDVIRTQPIDHSNFTIKITQQEFFEQLYVETPMEIKLTREIRYSSDNPVYVAGPRGSGKSTVGMKVKYNLEREGETFIVAIDIDAMKGDAFFDKKREDGNFKAYLRLKITDAYKNFFYGHNSPDLRFKLYEYLLNSHVPEEKRPKAFFQSLAQLISNFHLNLAKADDVEPLWLWIQQHYISNTDWVKETITKIDDSLELKHYALAMQHVTGFTRQVVWIDNIDNLGELDESEMNSAIRDLISVTPGIVHYVVAAREENLQQVDHPRNSFAEPFRSVVLSHYDDGSSKDDPAWLMPDSPKERIEQIYLKRLSFAARKANALPSDAVEPLSENEMAHLEQLVLHVIHAFDRERGLYIANNSIRDTLAILTGFLRYLLIKGIEQDGRPVASSYEDWSMQTELLFWLSRHADNAISYTFFNILEHSHAYLKDPDNMPSGCFLPYLTLTCIWGLSLENEKEQDNTFTLPEVRQVYERLQILGYQDSQVRNTLFKLCQQNTGKGKNNFIAIQIRGELTSPKDIEETHRLRLTYRGKVTLSSVCSSYGYLLGLVEKNLQSHGQEQKHKEVNPTSFLSALTAIAKAHLLSFNHIGRMLSTKEPNTWVQTYYGYFGTPIDSKYSRILKPEGLGFEKIGRLHRALFFELLLRSIRHYRVFTDESKLKANLDRLQNIYYNILKNIKKNQFYLDGDIRDDFRGF